MTDRPHSPPFAGSGTSPEPHARRARDSESNLEGDRSPPKRLGAGSLTGPPSESTPQFTRTRDTQTRWVRPILRPPGAVARLELGRQLEPCARHHKPAGRTLKADASRCRNHLGARPLRSPSVRTSAFVACSTTAARSASCCSMMLFESHLPPEPAHRSPIDRLSKGGKTHKRK